jgi:hypothetical protein
VILRLRGLGGQCRGGGLLFRGILSVLGRGWLGRSTATIAAADARRDEGLGCRCDVRIWDLQERSTFTRLHAISSLPWGER